MSKPGTVPTWATDATYTRPDISGDANKVAPSSGKITQGFEPDEKPSAEIWNHRLNLIGQWLSWLNGIFDSSDNLTIHNASVTGDLTLGGALLHGDRVLPISPHGWVPLDDDKLLFHQDIGFIELDAGGSAHITLQLPVGERIKAISFRAARTSGTLTGRLYEIDESSTATIVTPTGGSSSESSASGLFTMSATYATTIASNKVYKLVFSSSANGGQLLNARVTYDRIA